MEGERKQAVTARAVLKRLAVIVPMAVIAAFFLYPPVTVMDKAHLVGFAICHQIPSHSLFFGGKQLHLCARCTGIHLGTTINLVFILLVWKRYKAASFPPNMLLFTILLFIGLMGADGLNSYIATFFPDKWHLYQPTNWLRLTTGVFHGIALSTIVLPVFNFTLWADAQDEPVLRSFKELGYIAAAALIMIPVVLTGNALLLYPVTIVTTLSVLGMLTMVNTMIVITAARKENVFSTWQETIPYFLAGLAMSVLLVVFMDVFRTVVTGAGVFTMPT